MQTFLPQSLLCLTDLSALCRKHIFELRSASLTFLFTHTPPLFIYSKATFPSLFHLYSFDFPISPLFDFKRCGKYIFGTFSSFVDGQFESGTICKIHDSPISKRVTNFRENDIKLGDLEVTPLMPKQLLPSFNGGFRLISER